MHFQVKDVGSGFLVHDTGYPILILQNGFLIVTAIGVGLFLDGPGYRMTLGVGTLTTLEYGATTAFMAGFGCRLKLIDGSRIRLLFTITTDTLAGTRTIQLGELVTIMAITKVFEMDIGMDTGTAIGLAATQMRQHIARAIPL